MGHLSIVDVPPIIISLATSDSESESEFYSGEDLDRYNTLNSVK
jgi:hypothetical protein